MTTESYLYVILFFPFSDKPMSYLLHYFYFKDRKNEDECMKNDTTVD